MRSEDTHYFTTRETWYVELDWELKYKLLKQTSSFCIFSQKLD